MKTLRLWAMAAASFYRRQRPAPGHQQPRPTPARALRASERAHVLDVLASPRFVDRSPAEVVATLLDEGRYLCAERTMYRILAANQPVRERRNQRSHPCYTKPELVATGPNQTWSWDITRLRGPKRWTSFYLYVLLDIFSRYVVGWMVADRENAALAATLIEETCLKQGIEPQVLTLHSDRGAPMTSKCTAQLLADLGVTRSLSRPQVSDDNPFSEAQFKTLKYHPGFPGRFEDITAAIAFCRSFFPWYNTEHRHAGIAMLTPDDVHHHRAPDVLAKRGRTLQAAWALHPERFVHGTPKPAPLPEAVWINPPATSTTGETSPVNRNRQCLKVVDRFRTMVINALRGHCAEFGLIVAQGASKVEELVAIIEDPGDVRLPPLAREALGSLVEQLRSAQARIKQLEVTLLAWHRSNEASRRLATIPGVGVITATALVATIGDGAQFRSGRQLSAWLGLVPRQHSSGGKDRLGRISKRGDGYIRRLLVHGARTVLRWRRAKPGTGPGWTDRLLARRPTNVVLVAMANKTARVAWALLRYERIYRPTPA